MHPVIEGLMLGILLAVMVGTVFFVLLQSALEGGFFSGLAIAVGVLISDISMVFLLHMGISRLSSYPVFGDMLGLAGAGVLMVFGFRMSIRPERPNSRMSKIPVRFRLWSNWAKGVLLNSLNPFVIFFWIGVAGMVAARYSGNTHKMLFFYIGVLGMVFITDMAKIYLAQRLCVVVNMRNMSRANRVAGFALFFFAFRSLYLVYNRA